jgi:DNA-binding transcriptional ArsR family regulator
MELNCCESKKSKQELPEVVNFLKAISEENRLKILCILRKSSLCVCDIWQSLSLPQNLASHHLKVLKDLNLIEAKKEGTKVIYSLNSNNTEKYIKLLSKYI